jgi:hypothetical protein
MIENVLEIFLVLVQDCASAIVMAHEIYNIKDGRISRINR